MLKLLGRDHKLLMMSLLMWALGEGLWFNLRQLYLEQLGATPSQIGLAISIEAVARAVLLIPAGYLTDRFGARQVMIASWLTGIAGLLIGGLATTWQSFMPGMIVYALSGFAIPAISAYALSNLPEHSVHNHSQRVLTTIYTAYPIGLIVSPMLGGLIADQHGIRTCLLIAATLSVVSLLIVLLTRHVTPHPIVGRRGGKGLLYNRTFIGLVFFYMFAMVPVYGGFALLPNFLGSTQNCGGKSAIAAFHEDL
ncbi:MAG: MFS transporter [Anaerolineae bacterium]|nr:MFS transporter [Anaerolineae bacterium]